MKPKCYLSKEICCEKCERHSVCYLNCAFQITCENCDYKIENKGDKDMKEILVDDKTIYFAGIREGVKIPTKRESDAGYDIYANFEEDYILIKQHETKMIPTGLKSAFSNKWYMQLEERGSTGTKGMIQMCGVIDASFRGEWFVPITNARHDKVIAICKKGYEDKLKDLDVLIYPYEKAICQAVLLEVPKVNIKTISEEELMSIPSDRGEGMLGSSQK